MTYVNFLSDTIAAVISSRGQIVRPSVRHFGPFQMI